MKQLCTLFIAATLFIAKTNYCTAQVNVNDSLALVDLYNSTDGAHWTNNSGWLNRSVNTWFGITIVSHRVTELVLQYNNLQGTLPSSLGKLTHLTNLDLYNNSLFGSIPSSLGNLPNVQYIQLGFNKLTGSIPLSFSNLKNLTIFGVDNNLLTGKVPSLANTTKLSDIFFK